MLADGPPDAVVTRENLRTAYGVDVAIAGVEGAGIGRRPVWPE